MKINIKKALAATLALCAMTSGAVIPSAGTSLLAPKAVTASAANSEITIGDFTYTYYSYYNNTASIKAYSGNSSNPVIPETVSINGKSYKVTTIDAFAFSFKNCIETISIPDSCQLICESAFCNCQGLKTVIFPSNNKNLIINSRAFDNCGQLGEIKNISVNENYTIAKDAFRNCLNLKKINGSSPVYRWRNNVYLTNENFIAKHFNGIETVGFIQDYVSTKASAVVDQIRAEHPDYTDLQMAKALKDWVCDNALTAQQKWESENPGKRYTPDIQEQEEARPEYHRETSVFLYGAGVCEGYAKTYKRLLNAAGIEAEDAPGKRFKRYKEDGEIEYGYHAWNIIKLDGAWYNTDAYWEDCGTPSPQGWFMLSDKEIDEAEEYSYGYYNGGKKSPGYYHDKTGVYLGAPDYTICESDLITYSCYYPMGDVNKDGYVTQEDVDQLSAALECRGKVSRINADMNFDGYIDYSDLALLRTKSRNQY